MFLSKSQMLKGLPTVAKATESFSVVPKEVFSYGVEGQQKVKLGILTVPWGQGLYTAFVQFVQGKCWFSILRVAEDCDVDNGWQKY